MSSELDSFLANFPDHAPPPELGALWEFQESAGFEGYSEGFGLMADDKSGVASWSGDAAFLDRLIPFAQADGTGSFYALWLATEGADLSQAPVVVFGSEGGSHVVAGNIRELLQLLTYDSEPMVDHDEVSFYKDPDDHEPTEASADYREWLGSRLSLSVPPAPLDIVDAAQKRWQADYRAWFSRYVAE